MRNMNSHGRRRMPNKGKSTRYAGTMDGTMTAPGSKRQKALPKPSPALAPKPSGPVV